MWNLINDRLKTITIIIILINKIPKKMCQAVGNICIL